MTALPNSLETVTAIPPDIDDDNDWKKGLSLPAKDLRMKTAVCSHRIEDRIICVDYFRT
jgi:hypothetical protein